MASFIAYRGPSMLTGRPVVLVVVASTTNRKTGDMVQTYILSDEGIDPVNAARQGLDESVCGNCPARPVNGNTCYVTLVHGPLSVYRALMRGSYGSAVDEHSAAWGCRGRMVRVGTYGDPAAIPLWVWEFLLAGASGWTGYTHQWRTSDPGYMRFCMASCDSEQDAAEAAGRGFRWFRVRSEDEFLLAGEFACPASEEAGKVRTCATCGACKGTGERGIRPGSVAIVVHGSRKGNWASK